MSVSSAFTRQLYACVSIERMKGTSACPPRRIMRSPSLLDQRLGQLDAVPVGIEDVDEAHLPRQLEHDADVHVLAAEALRLGLDVADVDRRDAAFGIRLALRQCDPHVAVLQLRPAVVPVDERLLEPEQA